LAEAVAPGGTVFAVDTEPKLVAYLRDRAERDKADDVVPVLASADNPRLPEHGVDVVLIVDTYHHLDDRLTYLRRLGRVLAPGGRVAVIDWEKRETPVGPELAHRLAREAVVAEMEGAGYRYLGEPATLPYQYFLIFVLSGKAS
jgi:ubiquinone/menaquinone biosynthesis C-methylase UbiE